MNRARPADPSNRKVAFTSADKLTPELCPMCRQNEAGFMGGACSACAARLVRRGGTQA